MIQEILIAVGLSLFGVYGAVVRWTNLSNGYTGKEKVFLLISKALTGSFGGLLVYCVYTFTNAMFPTTEIHPGFAFAVAGLSGFKGEVVIDWLGEKYILKQSRPPDDDAKKKDE